MKKAKPLTKLITEALQKHDKVLVLTQDHKLVKDFLLDEPGRWNVTIDPRWWDKEEFRDEKITEGKTKEGYKVGIDYEGEDGCISERGGRFIFSCRYKNSSEKNIPIFKNHFTFPEIKKETNYSPILAIQKEEGPLCLIPESIHQYHLLHDQLTLQGITHSLDSSGDNKSVHLMKFPRYIKGYKTAVVYGLRPMQELMCLHPFETVVIVQPEDVTAYYRLDVINTLAKCFNETPDCALSADYLNFKTFINPKTIERNLMIMEMAGCVTRVRTDSESIIIEKRGQAPDAIEYHAIPEGTWRISKLLNHLRLPREELLPLLKRYESNGLIFSYTNAPALKLWRWRADPIVNRLKQVIDFFHEDQILLNDLVKFGESALNRWIEKKIEDHCLSFHSQAVVISIDGRQTLINPAGAALRS